MLLTWQKHTSTKRKMQEGMDRVSQLCYNNDLTISITKTELVHQSAPGIVHNEPVITVKGQKLQVVDKITLMMK